MMKIKENNQKMTQNNITLKENERLDDLLFNDMHIIQNKERYCFTSDAVLLANFAKAKKSDSALDLCSGSGIVGILFYAKNLCKEQTLVEIQPEFCDMASRSVALNNLQDKIKVINSSVQDLPKLMQGKTFDVITCNPPYKTTQNHKISEKEHIAMCKYELTLTLDELIKSVSKLLKFGGKFFFVHETNRLSEIILTLKKYNMEAKRIELCFPQNKKTSNVVLIEAVLGAKSGVVVTKTTN